MSPPHLASGNWHESWAKYVSNTKMGAQSITLFSMKKESSTAMCFDGDFPQHPYYLDTHSCLTCLSTFDPAQAI